MLKIEDLVLRECCIDNEIAKAIALLPSLHSLYVGWMGNGNLSNESISELLHSQWLLERRPIERESQAPLRFKLVRDEIDVTASK